jgi:transcription elongation GreA/GreB family factor
MDIKSRLLTRCFSFVEEREKTVNETITSNQKALQSETKSSAGDKHETGRAMLQLEMEKAGQQLSSIKLLKETLQKVDIGNTSETIRLGSLVITNKGNYFLAVSVGKVMVKNKSYFVISTSSPIGKLLLGKQKGDAFVFNGMKFQIVEVL